MSAKNSNINDFINSLASKSPTPGGGGASALVGAIGTSLSSMVCNLTLGKKKYKDVQEDIENILLKASSIQEELLNLIDEDAKAFEPLALAYKLPKTTDQEQLEKDTIMEEALKEASLVPFKIMQVIIKSLDLHYELKDKGTIMAISDVGVGAILLKSALQGASLNVFINTKLMKNRVFAEELNAKTCELLDCGINIADEIFNTVEGKLK